MMVEKGKKNHPYLLPKIWDTSVFFIFSLLGWELFILYLRNLFFPKVWVYTHGDTFSFCCGHCTMFQFCSYNAMNFEYLYYMAIQNLMYSIECSFWPLSLTLKLHWCIICNSSLKWLSNLFVYNPSPLKWL